MLFQKSKRALKKHVCSKHAQIIEKFIRAHSETIREYKRKILQLISKLGKRSHRDIILKSSSEPQLIREFVESIFIV